MAGLDLSFGYTPMQFEKINLIGSELSEHAISSLVLSVPNITYLDLRGNRLSAQFGWQLVKAMKKRYLNLEFCNGVPLRELRANQIQSLNLSSFKSHHGMYGIEVVGAIFLAHFLRLNSSLTYLNFKRNDVEKDGAKALAQSLLGNPQCMLSTVNFMGAHKQKPGIDFQQFRTSSLRVVHLPHRLLDDDDFVFLEEWLRRYDCVEDLDVSDNLFYRDGVRKLARYIKETKTLRKLNCSGLPVDLDSTQLLAQAVVANDTLEQVGMPLGACDDNVERHQMFQQLGLGLQGHQHLQAFASNKAGTLEYANLGMVRSGQVKEFPPQRSGNWPAAQMAVYMWLVAAVKPPVEKLSLGPGARPLKDYPSCIATPFELWPVLPTLVHDLNRTLVHVSVNVGPPPTGQTGGPCRDVGGPPRTMELMRVLTRCTSLKTLYLLGYASATMKESQLPSEWSSVGSAPRWLLDDRMRRQRVHWQALYGLLSTNTMQGLETFNDLRVGGSLRDQPELTCMLLLQCLEGVAADLTMEPQPNGEAGKLEARLQARADVDAFCDALRLLSRTPLLIELMFTEKNSEKIKAAQARLAGPLSGSTVGEAGPRFTHSVVLKNNQVSEILLKSVDCHAPLREFCYENITQTLPGLFACLCAKDTPLPVEKIRVEPKWINSSRAAKRFSEQERKWLDGVQASLIRSTHFQMVHTASKGEVPREDIENMSLQEFADLMTGYSVDEAAPNEKHLPRTPWRCYPSLRKYLKPEEGDEPLLVPLPLDDNTAGSLQLQKLSLCMCDLRARLVRSARPDEWPLPSRPLWYGPQRLIRPGDWGEYDPPQREEEPEEGQPDVDPDDIPVRFHWRPSSSFRVGTRRSCEMIAQVMSKDEKPFADTLLHESLQSLLSEASTLRSLDLRGNGLTREDAILLLDLLGKHQTLVRLNLIPVTVDEAQASTELVMDGSGVPRLPEPIPGQEDEEEPQDPDGEAYATEALEADFVRLDEGDGYVFLSLVTPQYFPELVRVELRQLEIPQDTTLAHITDALLNLPSVSQLRLSQLKLSSRGASLLLQAVTEMAPRLESLNGLPLARLVQRRDAPEGSPPLELPPDVEWNDFPLGAMARLSLWPAAQLPPNVDGQGFQLHGQHLTDVGLRGLCVMLRHFAGQDRGMGSRLSASPLQLTRIDLSGNPQITDATVADLCHTLQHPSMGGSLRHSLRDLSVRSCMKLKSRSALELQSFVTHVRDAAAGRSGGGGGEVPALQTINGVDLEALQNAGRTGAGVAGGRAGGLPMLLRTYVESQGAGKGPLRPQFAALSECDALFFASMLHLWPHIPYCHVHVVVPRDLSADQQRGKGGFLTWGREEAISEEGLFGGPVTVTNDSPFPPPQSATKQVAAAVQAHLDAAKRLFEACPISTQLRLSVSPAIPGCEDLLAAGDPRVLGVAPGADRQGGAPSTLTQIKQRLQQRAAKRRRAEARRQGVQGEPPLMRPLYVNNINSQRLHCCFRTLYGKDEMEIEHVDIMPDERCSVSLPTEVDVSQAFAVATSVDLQHLDLCPLHLVGLSQVTDMPVLTHINLNHNHLGDSGVELLFKGLVDAGSSVVHVAVSENNVGDEGATTIAASLGSLPRLTSLELCENFIQERGSIAIAEAIGGVAPLPEEGEAEEVAPVGPLPVLSVDLRGNRSRELGARRWAEVICNHPDLKFLCLAQNELGLLTKENFLDLVCAAVASAALSVLDLQDNFPRPARGKARHSMGPPPKEVIEELLADLPPGEFDPAEVRKAVFIRRHRGGGGGVAEKKGRQPQQGSGAGGGSRHAGGGVPASPAGSNPAGPP